MSDTVERVKKIVVDNLGVDADKVTESASFIDDLGADSHELLIVGQLTADLVHLRADRQLASLRSATWA